MSELGLYLFGTPRIERDGAAVLVGRRKAMALLFYLALTGQSYTRDALAALLWPDTDPAAAPGELRRALSTLRKAVGTDWIEASRETVGLRHEAGLWVDVAHFRRLLETCRHHGHPASEVCATCREALTEAVALAHGELLAGFTLPDSAEFDDWQMYEREALRGELASALARLARLLATSAEANSAQAIGYARRWLALDPLHEPAHRLLMQLYAQSGQRQSAFQQYQECARLLKAELGAVPSEETTALHERIRSGEFAPAQGAIP